MVLKVIAIRLLKITDDNSKETNYLYDNLNRRTRETLADSTYKEFTYDDAGNITNIRLNDSTQITQVFDDINRLTSRSINPGTGVVGVTSESYTYDGLSRMATAYNSYSTVTFGYDTMSRMLTEQQQLSGFNARTATSAYNNVGFRTSLTYPSNKVINFVPDNVNRISQITDNAYPANVIAEYTYVGYRVEERAYLNNTNLTVNYDNNGRVITYSHGANVAEFAYGYDKEDNKLFEKRTVPYGAKGDAFVYDSIYRATGVKYGVPNTELNVATDWANYNNYDSIEQFNLDGVGNRLNVYNGVTTTYTTNNLNEYTNISGTDLTYDDNGNLTGDGTYTYSYDYANRLIEVKEGETSIALFKYDALGRRIQKTTASTTTNYYYDGGRVIEECDGLNSDTLVASYVHGNGIDELLQAEYPIDSDQHPISGTYYFHENTLGSIYAVTDEDGNVVERYDYTIYGKVSFFDGSGTPISDSAIGNCYLFTGREYDPEIKLYNYRARYYSPDLGRFLGRDPIGYVDGMNLYAYVDNNPMNFIDPFGLCKGNFTTPVSFSQGGSLFEGLTSQDYSSTYINPHPVAPNAQVVPIIPPAGEKHPLWTWGTPLSKEEYEKLQKENDKVSIGPSENLMEMPSKEELRELELKLYVQEHNIPFMSQESMEDMMWYMVPGGTALRTTKPFVSAGKGFVKKWVGAGVKWLGGKLGIIKGVEKFTQAQLEHYQRQLATAGKDSLIKSRNTLLKKLEEHRDKIEI